MKNTTRSALMVTALAVTFSADRAPAQVDQGACCAATTSRVDALMNPVTGGDERFFSATGSPTTVMFLVGTMSTMQDYVTPLPSGAAGCTDAAVDAIYLMGNALLDGATPIDADPTLASIFFDPAQTYGATKTRVHANSFNPGNFTTLTPRDCTNMGLTAGETTTCGTCLTSKGWYRKNDATWVVRGGLLNQNPPKFVTTRAVVKEVAASLSNVRIGFAAFHPGGSDYYDAPRIPVRASPACNALSPIDSSAVLATVRTSINALRFDGTERQIGEALFGIGGYFSTRTQWQTWFNGIPSVTGYPGSASWNNGSTMWTNLTTPTAAYGTLPLIWGAGEQYCSECQQTMAIVLTDGTPMADNSVPVTKMMSLLIAQGAVRPDGTPLTFNPNVGGTCPNPTATGGINFCDRFGSTKCGCDYPSSPQGPDNGNRNFMDDVAFFLANMDLRPDLPGKQSVYTYTVGLGDNSPMLQSIAYAGGGQFYSANNAIQLKSAVIAAIQDVQSKTTGFSGASVAAVQSGGGTEAILPRLLPRADKPWLGSLWRFQMFNEFVEGSSITDGGLNNIVMIDDAGVPVTEDLVTGRFIKSGTASAADEFWEAGTKLVANGHASRKLWTVRDSNNDGAFTSADALLELTVANRATVRQYLGILDTPFCPRFGGVPGTMLTTLNLTATQLVTAVNAVYPATFGFGTPTNQAQTDDVCVAGFILYLRGADLADEDGDNDRTETRRSVLADIFHSTPVSVGPGVEPFLCELGLVNQCTRTLYSQNLATTATPLTPYPSEVNCASTTIPRNAYDAWQYRSRKRDKVVLVGSNDGVLHAFHNGRATETCTSGNSVVTYNQGTGREIWGFIPPDQLSRLQDQMLGHTYGVDGDIMVRDVWADGSGVAYGPGGIPAPAPAPANGMKEREEFHTVAIAAEGRGGTHYFAIEVAFNSTGNDQDTVVDRPRFLWMFPQPCSSEAALFGKTLYSLAPKAPPIGPVLTQATSLTQPRYGFNTRETWVAALSGGWSPGREKGRGVYIVDAFNGQVNGRQDNLWWKLGFDENANGDFAPVKKLSQSVSAPVALVDYGANSDPKQDGFFDTALFGDAQGQVWVARLFQPAAVNTTTKLVENWRGARTFEMDQNGIPLPPADGDPEPDDPNVKSSANREPFYYLPSVVIEPGTNTLRAFLGTGERYSVLDAPNGVCRFDNPLACAKAQCNEVKVRYKLDGPLINLTKLEATFKKRQFSKAKEQWTSRSDAVCGTPGSDNVRAQFEEYKINSCRMTDTTTVNPGRVNDADVRCRQNSAGTSYTCNYSSTPTQLTQELLPAATTDGAGLGKNRYFGFVAYGGTRVFTEGDATAVTFDGNRVTDRPTGALVDVTNTTCTGPSACTGAIAGVSSFGWFLDYDVNATKTATGSALIASCVLWNTLTPTAGTGSSCAAGAGNPDARIFQANYLTGAPDCAEGFLDGGASLRFLTRKVVSPPPEPATAIQISKAGQVRYSALIVEPGQTTSVNVTSGQDILQLVNELPISRALHQCRHADGGCSTVP